MHEIVNLRKNKHIHAGKLNETEDPARSPEIYALRNH